MAQKLGVKETGNPRKDSLMVGHLNNLQLKTVKCFHPSPYSMGIFTPRRPIREWALSSTLIVIRLVAHNAINWRNAKPVSEKPILQYMLWN